MRTVPLPSELLRKLGDALSNGAGSIAWDLGFRTLCSVQVQGVLKGTGSLPADMAQNSRFGSVLQEVRAGL